MKNIMIFSVIFIFLNADTLNYKILKENNTVTIKTNTGKSVSNRNNKIITIDLNSHVSFFKNMPKYYKFKIINEKKILSNYILSGDKLKIFIPEKECIEIFKIEAKPDIYNK